MFIPAQSVSEVTQTAGQSDAQMARTNYVTARIKLRAAIFDSKKRCWSDLCCQMDNDPWGKTYKLVMGKHGSRNRGSDSKGREAEIAYFLFPAAPVTIWSEAPSPAVNNIFEAFDPDLNTFDFRMVIPRFTADELSKAVKRLSPRKAPGPSNPERGVKNVRDFLPDDRAGHLQ